MRRLLGFALATSLGLSLVGCSDSTSSSSPAADAAVTTPDAAVTDAGSATDSGASSSSDGGARPSAQLQRNGSIKLTRSP